MKHIARAKAYFEDARLLWLRCVPAALICFILAFLLIYAPAKASRGVADGLELCVRTVIPSLFPFLFVSSLTVTSGVHMKIGGLFSKATRLIFKQPPAAAAVIFMSLIGGLPVGARMAAQVYENGDLTKNQAQRLCLFCVNAGPAFIISAVGVAMLGSYKAGVIIYASLTLSSLVLGVLTRFLSDGDESNCARRIPEVSPTLVASLTRAADSSARAMLSVCVWVTLFTCITALLKTDGSSPGLRAAISAVCEVTTGCRDTAGVYPIPVTAGIIGWAGLSAHCQILEGIVKLKVRLRLFFAARILSGALGAVICQWLLRLFPVESAAFAAHGEVIAVPFSACAPVTAGLLLMCALMLLGENFSLQMKSNG